MHYIVYITENLINGKVYIGCHKTENLDDGYLGSGKILKRAIKKYGEENFVRYDVFIFDNEEMMFKAEKMLANDEIVKDKETYNLKLGGNGGWDHIDEKIRQETANKRDYKDEKYLKKARAASKKAIKEGKIKLNRFPKGTKINYDWTGKKHKEETKKKIGAANKKMIGPKNSQYGTMWITNGKENKKINKIDQIPDGWYRGRVIKLKRK